VAFSRSDGVVTAVTRLSLRLEQAGGWRDTEVALPDGTWVDLLGGRREFTGGRARAADLFARRPVALLTRHGVA
jgi:(1->4)-alpha-D-glucan 1-alpha-D-glucosylmutase